VTIALSSRALARSVPNGFSMMTRDPRRLALAVDEARGREIADDGGEELGRDRQIEQAIAAETELGVEVVEPLLQLQKRLAVVVVPGLIVQGAHEGVVGRDRGAARPRAGRARTVAGAALQLPRASPRGTARRTSACARSRSRRSGREGSRPLAADRAPE